MSNNELPQMAAAGGLVLCGGSHALLIRKHGQWDNPEGEAQEEGTGGEVRAAGGVGGDRD